jgi:cellulose synthase/poly-beta-1,6-N-acetylglucosamine synthase-like glycosyltransferase
MAAETIMLASFVLLAWTYLLYPALVLSLAARKNRHRTKESGLTTSSDRAHPSVSIIMSVHNEAKVIEEKVRSMMVSDYPPDITEFIIGSDASDDDTIRILQELSAVDSRIRFIGYEERRGKPAVLNDLIREASGEVLIITDANVIFSPDTVRSLAEGFRLDGTGLCDATVVPRTRIESGITRQENFYSRFETTLKRSEGILWDTIPGPYGGCYAIRRELFPLLPYNTLVDDLYVGLTVMKRGFASRNIPGAKVFEDIQPGMSEQFSRRIRIAAGSYQNLFRFGPFPSRKMNVSFAFFSHKVLRWLTPLFLILFFMTTVILSSRSQIYFCLSAIQLILIFLSALDLVLDRYGRMIRYQRYVTQFLMMNAALVAGFARAAGGIGSGIWEPTKRV